MKALAIYPETKTIRVIDTDPPRRAADNEVLVKMLEVGVCGTDAEIARFEYGTPPDDSDYLILGHEGLGEVVETGPVVKNLRPGDLVVPTVRRPCGQPGCVPCSIGRQDFCSTGEFKERGIHKLHGFMTEMIVEEERYLHRVPPTLRDSAVLIEPLTISQKGLRQVHDIQDRLPWACSTDDASRTGGENTLSCRRTLVLGGGPVGLLGAMTLKDAGFQTAIYSHIGTVSERLQVASAIGCELIPSEETSPEDLLDRVGKVDVIFEAVGASQLAFDVLELLGYNAIFVFTGVPGRKTRASINTDIIMRNLVLKNQALVGTVNAALEDFVNAITALERFDQKWPGVPASLKTEALSLEAVPSVLTGKGGKKGIKRYVRLA